MSCARTAKSNWGWLPGCVLLGVLLAAPQVVWGAPVKKPAALVAMTVRGVKPVEGSFVVLLESPKDKRVLPIWIGAAEAQAIHLRLHDQKPPRPLTHDLMDTTLAVLRTTIVRVEVDELRDRVFYGKLVLKDAKGKRYRIDGRPSDLIVLAVGAKVPILVAAKVLDQAGIESTAPPAGDPPAPEREKIPPAKRTETL